MSRLELQPGTIVQITPSTEHMEDSWYCGDLPSGSHMQYLPLHDLVGKVAEVQSSNMIYVPDLEIYVRGVCWTEYLTVISKP